MSDTEMTIGTRHATPGVVLVASLLLLAPAGPSAAEPAPLEAQVVWARGSRVYVVARDSLALQPLSRLTFVLESESVATGEVEHVVDGRMAMAWVTSGSLAGVRVLDRLRVLVESPRGPRTLRIGGPSEKRRQLLFACESVAVAPALVPLAYRLDERRASYRLVRNASDSARAGWPDTLIVRVFDDAADQQIALERGDLDIAVFWPGELSADMRDHPRWRERLTWPLARAVIGEIPESGSASSRCAAALGMADAFRELGETVFRGDLDASRDRPAVCGDSLPASRAAVRYAVDPSCPGRVTIERFLNRDAAKGGASGPVVRVSFADPRAFASDDVSVATARGQVVCAPHVLPYARSLGAAVFGALFDCVGPERRP